MFCAQIAWRARSCSKNGDESLTTRGFQRFFFSALFFQLAFKRHPLKKVPLCFLALVFERFLAEVPLEELGSPRRHRDGLIQTINTSFFFFFFFLFFFGFWSFFGCFWCFLWFVFKKPWVLIALHAGTAATLRCLECCRGPRSLSRLIR